MSFFNVLFPVHFIDLSAQAKRRWYRVIVAGDLFLLSFFQGWAAIWGHYWQNVGWLPLALVDSWEIKVGSI